MVECSHCGTEVRLRTFRDHIVKYWNQSDQCWRQTLGLMPRNPRNGEEPNLLILTRSQVTVNFPELLELYGGNEWPQFGYTNVEPVGVWHKKRAVGSDVHDDEEHKMVMDMDGGYGSGSDSSVEGGISDPEVRAVHTHHRSYMQPFPNKADRKSKALMALKVWQLVFRIPLSALTTLLLILATFFDSVFDFDGEDDRDDDDVPVEINDKSHSVTPYSLDKHLGMGSQDDSMYFTTYAWCSTCSSIYLPEQLCVGNQTHVKSCTNIPYPRHPTTIGRRMCRSVLGDITKVNGKSTFRPKVPYHYKSLLDQLTEMFARPNFEAQIEHWRTRDHIDGYMSDVYDGEVWTNNQRFFSKDRSLAFMLNVDWFQPYERTQYSCGAVYLCILNLPRHLRYKKEYMILVSLLPGSKEKIQNLNELLQPLIEELLMLYDGCLLDVEGHDAGLLVYGILLCISCDLPATRKVIGMKSANHCCSKCQKIFERHDTGRVNKSGQPVYWWDKSGNKYNQWTERHNEGVRALGVQYLDCTSRTQQNNFLSHNCVRYSVISLLPYFDMVQHVVVDPMHNLWMVSHINHML